jgi:DNA-binding NtrC family response regulator
MATSKLPRTPGPSTVPALSAIHASDWTEDGRTEFSVEREGGVVVPRVVILDGDALRIGSHPSNELVLVDSRVSRFHCILRRHAGHWRVEDCGSLNGTRINGVAVRDADLALPLCRLEVGDTTIRVRMLDSRASVPLLPRASFGSLHGSSPSMRRLFAMLERVADSEASVLIEGESGTGKELVATEIVRRGGRADKPFIIVDCGAISPALIESTLFGHCRGAFTGAERDRLGAFEEAAGGTVFLDEIGEMPSEMQPKLLRVLESRSVCRVGESRHRPVDVRILAATNRRLQREVNHGRFREDLYFRLSVVTVRVPPLRERLEDLELLVPVLLESLGASDTEELFGPDVLAQLAEYDWPGNVRELRNFVERALVLRSVVPTASDADVEHENESDIITAAVDLGVPLKLAKEHLVTTFEKKYIRALLEWSGGNVSRAAKKAGMDRINLHRLIQRYDLRGSRSMSD